MQHMFHIQACVSVTVGVTSSEEYQTQKRNYGFPPDLLTKDLHMCNGLN